MRLRTIKGRSVSEALRRVQKELGPGALVLETHEKDGATEVIAADVEREEPTEGLMRLRAELALLRRELTRTSAAAPAAAETRAADQHAVLPRLAKVAARLRDQDLRPDLVERVLKMLSVAPRTQGEAIDPARSEYCRNAVAGMLPDVGSGGTKRARCYAFVGPPGAGKTTTIAKLAEQSRSAGDRTFGVITLDGDRPGAAEVLASCAQRLKIPFRSARGPSDLVKAIDSLAQLQTILVDTAGLGYREGAALAALRERINQPHQIAVHLVLPANQESRSMLSTAKALVPLKPAALVFTKVDETERFGDLVNLPNEFGLPVAALGHGRSLQGDLARATRKLIADLVLGRRSSTLERISE